MVTELEQAQTLLTRVYGKWHPRYNAQREKLAAVLTEHPSARIEVCSDEKTGVRYGQAKCRAGRCRKIGHTTFVRQLWAVWTA